MAASYSARLLASGPDRFAVMSRLCRMFGFAPAEAKAVLDGGPFMLVSDGSPWDAEHAAARFREVGAEVEVFISVDCPSNSHPAGEPA